MLEKSLFRVLGTIVGSLFGILLLVASDGQTWAIVIGLSLWVGLCAGAGNVVRGFLSYGVILAGYSASMVTLLHSARSAGHLAVGVDRMLTVLIGVGIALAIGWLFAGRNDPDSLGLRVRRLSRRILEDLAHHLEGTRSHDVNEHQRLLAEMAVIEDELDGHAAGSLRSRDGVRSVRRLLSAQVAMLLWTRRRQPPAGESPLTVALKDAAAALELPGGTGTANAALRRSVELAAADPAMHETLAALARAIHAQGAATGNEARSPASSGVVLHRDWIGAREALLRAGGVTLAVGLLWLATGWPAGSLMMLGITIMTTVFSTADNPAHTMRYVMIGQSLGAAGALACRWLIWPLATGEPGLVVSMFPFILLGGVLFAHRRTAPVGFDYNMILLLLLQPAWPLAGSFAGSLTTAVAVVLAPMVALVAYRLIFPVSGERRMRTLIAMMVREIEAMAARPGVSRQRAVWRARLYHRVLRLVRWAEKTGASPERVIEGGFAVLLLGSAILHIDELLLKPDLAAGTRRKLEAARARLRRVGSDPRRAVKALTDVARYLEKEPDADPALLREAAAELSEQNRFFQEAKSDIALPTDVPRPTGVRRSRPSRAIEASRPARGKDGGS
ncbi:FUSC family protein [Aureimonas populi]|uniref:FUSC family protein n=1 Tax=Aureimonas populi TaxID=1701758 RepID=A0ABW5CNJ3_9HYPH|nr:FUSC family protein [Aureimonas populi]